MIKLNKLKRKLQGSNDFVGPRTTVKKQTLRKKNGNNKYIKLKEMGNITPITDHYSRNKYMGDNLDESSISC